MRQMVQQIRDGWFLQNLQAPRYGHLLPPATAPMGHPLRGLGTCPSSFAHQLPDS
jgi:hypothetical protein